MDNSLQKIQMENVNNATKLELELLQLNLWTELQNGSNSALDKDFSQRLADIIQQPVHVIMLTLGFLGMCANIGSIVAVFHTGGIYNRRELSIHLKLIVSLTASIIFTILGHLLNIFGKAMESSSHSLSEPPESRLLAACFYAVTSSLNYTSYLIYLLNLSVMAVDHYVAILYPLHYNTLMAKRSCCLVLGVPWVLAAMGGFLNFVHVDTDVHQSKFLNYCESLMNTEQKSQFFVLAVALGSIFIVSFIYLCIFWEVKKMHARAQYSYPNDSLHSNKAVITTLLIMGTFYLCWLPYCTFQSIMLAQIHLNSRIVTIDNMTTELINKVLSILLLLNCLLDPMIYAFRLEAVRNGYRNFVTKMKNWYYQKRCKSHCTASLNRTTPTNEFNLLDGTKEEGTIITEVNSESCSLV